MRGGTRLRGPEVLGHLGASEFEPSFQQFGVSDTPSHLFRGLAGCVLRVLSATFILSKNSCVLDAKSRLESANLS